MVAEFFLPGYKSRFWFSLPTRYQDRIERLNLYLYYNLGTVKLTQLLLVNAII